LAEGTVQGITVDNKSDYKGAKILVDITAPSMGNLDVYRIVVNDSVSMRQMNRNMPMPPKQQTSAKPRYMLFPELSFDKSGYIVVLDPNLKVVNGQLAYELTVTNPDGIRVKYFYDMKTGLKLRQYTDVPGSAVMEFDDYRNIETGIKIPFSEKTNIVGQPIEFKVKSTKVNSGLADDLFK